MKKIVMTSLLCGVLFATSCSSENEIVKTNEFLKTEEMKSFDKAFRSLGDPQNKPTAEERRSGSTELSDRRKEILLPSSIALIKSTGVSDEELQRTTKGDMTATIVWAIKINLEKNARNQKVVKSEN